MASASSDRFGLSATVTSLSRRAKPLQHCHQILAAISGLRNKMRRPEMAAKGRRLQSLCTTVESRHPIAQKPGSGFYALRQTRRWIMLSSLSQLTDEQIAEIRALEQKLGKTLLAFSKFEVVSDDLSEAELALLQGLEDKLGTMLVAVRDLRHKS
jgi:hypothetical protein